MKKILALLSFCLIFMTSSYAQDYSWGIGGRLGYSNGFSAKWLYAGNETNYYGLEGTVSAFNNGMAVTGLWEYQKEIHFPNGGSRYSALYWFAGLGGHFGNFQSIGNSSLNASTFGVNGTVGLEYVFADFPLTLSADFRPLHSFYNRDQFNPHAYDVGFAVRFAFKSY